MGHIVLGISITGHTWNNMFLLTHVRTLAGSGHPLAPLTTLLPPFITLHKFPEHHSPYPPSCSPHHTTSCPFPCQTTAVGFLPTFPMMSICLSLMKSSPTLCFVSTPPPDIYCGRALVNLSPNSCARISRQCCFMSNNLKKTYSFFTL